MTFDHHAMVQPALPRGARGERWTCWLDLSETRSNVADLGKPEIGPRAPG
jgi:hypothetical protein